MQYAMIFFQTRSTLGLLFKLLLALINVVWSWGLTDTVKKSTMFKASYKFYYGRTLSDASMLYFADVF